MNYHKSIIKHAFILLSLSSTILAEESTQIAMTESSAIESEMDDIFGVSETVQQSDFQIEYITVETTNETSSIIQETVIPVREGEFSLVLEENVIRYNLPTEIAEPTIELRDLDGTILNSSRHSANDISGQFTTESLDEGFYIVRVLDEEGNSLKEAYAIAVN